MLNCLMQFVYLVYMVSALPTLLYVQHEFNTSKTTRNNTKNYTKQTRQRTTQNKQDKEPHKTNKTKNYTKQNTNKQHIYQVTQIQDCGFNLWEMYTQRITTCGNVEFLICFGT